VQPRPSFAKSALSDSPERQLLETSMGIADVPGREFASQLRALI
jgi:hypothetical protein